VNPIKRFLKEYAKTAAAFVVGVVGNMIVNLVNGGAPWPQTSAEWLQYALTSFGAAIATLIVPNKITQKQLDNDPHVVGGTVVDVPVAASAPTIGEYPAPWPKP
jgi:hypothetical protein